MSMRINIHPQNPCDSSLHSLVKDVFKVCASWGTCDCTLFNRYRTSKGLFVSSKTIPVFKWKGGALVSITTVFMKHHILSAMLLTWVTWVYFPIPFLFFFPSERKKDLLLPAGSREHWGFFPECVSVSPFLCWSRTLDCPHSRKGSGTSCAWDNSASLVYCLNWRPPVFYLCTPVTCTELPLLFTQLLITSLKSSHIWGTGAGGACSACAPGVWALVQHAHGRVAPEPADVRWRGSGILRGGVGLAGFGPKEPAPERDAGELQEPGLAG